jgi:cell division protein FtsI (penicillin-binding protein 3)
MVAAAEVLDYLDIPFHADFPIEENGLVWGVGDTDVGTISLKEDLEGDGLMPDLRGYGLRDAVFLLEKMGAKVKVKGVGRVMKQSIKPGKILAKGTEVVLDLGMTNSKKKSSAAVAPLVTDSTAVGQNADSVVKKNISELPVQKKKTN